MNIGSLFVELGVSGSKSALGVISSVSRGLRDTTLIANQTVSLFSQLYAGVRDLSEGSSQYATNLKIVSSNLNVSADRLQRWDYAAKLAGASTGEALGSMQSLQKVLLNLRDKGDAPEYFQLIAQNLSKVNDSFDFNRFLNDTDYAMGALRNLAQSGEIEGMRLNKAFESIGFGSNFIHFLRTSKTELESISKDLLISNDDIKVLDNVKKSWVEIDQVIQKTFVDIAKVFDKEFINEIKELIISLSQLLKGTLELLKDKGIIKDATEVVSTTTGWISNPKKAFSNWIDSNREATNKLLAPPDFLRNISEMTKDQRQQVINFNQNFSNTEPETVTSASRKGVIDANQLSNAHAQTGGSL